ncbi:hypothetical protein P5673_006736 [Acropora cervicornis]|uniref:Uncharacterized protein n=1 Tax=Acropora cervicornis TaxID=6130 RepID=A0AAD9QX41_ACRCE|nr:hypothetical protein P5673_006736 [Acropora cervicornis]
MSAQGQNHVPMYIFNTGTILRSEIAAQMAPVLVIWLSVVVDYLRVLPCCEQDTYSMQVPYHSSTTALVDSTERLNRGQNAYEMSYRNGSGYKTPLDSSQTDWDGYMKGFNKDTDSGLFDDERYDFSDSEPSTPYQSFKREQYFTDTHL